MKTRVFILLCAVFIAGNLFAQSQKNTDKKLENIEKLSLSVNMHCPSCAEKIENTLKNLKGVQKIEADFITKKVVVFYDKNKIKEEKIIRKIEEAGYIVNKIIE